MVAKKKTTKKTGTDIPLENIPERTTRRVHTPEFKREVANRAIAGESMERLAEEFDISRSLVSSWTDKVQKGIPLASHGGNRLAKPAGTDNAAAILRTALAGAMKARDERLEAAASIVEMDGGSGREAADLAKKIRAFKRTPSTT